MLVTGYPSYANCAGYSQCKALGLACWTCYQLLLETYYVTQSLSPGVSLYDTQFRDVITAQVLQIWAQAGNRGPATH